MDLTAVGVHVFAGGFCAGVKEAGWQVDHHLETHGFGLDTARRLCNIEPINEPEANWPRMPALMAFGNPRCTAFSTVTSGDKYAGTAHGPWAKQTCDIQQMVKYTAGHYDFVVWESVQQAYTVGKDLVDWSIKEYFEPKKYRIAHLFLNAGSFGNSQQRKRYFFVAYRDCYKFNVVPPVITPHYATLWDAIGHLKDRPTREQRMRGSADGFDEYDFDCLPPLNENSRHTIQVLPNGWSHNTLGRHGYHLLSEMDKIKWDYRDSHMPFSLHALRRLQWCRPSPTMTSSAHQWVHPEHHRTLTIGELSTIMGWNTIPVGPSPVAQIAKGVVPSVGKWLAQQIELSYTGHWGSDDWESSYDDKQGMWVGGDAAGKLEKTFDLTKYCGKFFDYDKHFDAGVLTPKHRFNVDSATGRPIVPWDVIRQQSGVDSTRDRWALADIEQP